MLGAFCTGGGGASCTVRVEDVVLYCVAVQCSQETWAQADGAVFSDAKVQAILQGDTRQAVGARHAQRPLGRRPITSKENYIP